MTDAELLELIEQTAPEDLTVEQIELLRARIVESAELRAAVGAQLELEQYLSATLARPALSPETIIGMSGTTTGFSLAKLFGWGAAATLGLAIVAAVVAPPLIKDKTRVALKPVVEQPKTAAELKKPATKDAADKTPTAEKLAIATGGKSAPAQPGKAADADDSPLDGFGGAAVPAQQIPPLERVLIEAEQFARGNVQVDTTRFGRNIGVITGPKGFHFVEYELNFPAAGKYSVEIRYAADMARPMRMSINGKVVKEGVADKDTGSFAADSQKWSNEGVFEFAAGKNVLRLETSNRKAKGPGFPNIDKLALAPAGPATGAAIAVAEPWDDYFKDKAPVPAFEKVCFDDLFAVAGAPAQQSLDRWLETIKGERQPFRNRRQSGVQLNGLFKLRSPWPSNGALRLALFDQHRLRIHFWTGAEGITLQYFQHPRPQWVAYASVRRGEDPQPATYSLLGTDNDRYARTGPGPIDVRTQDGTLVLSRGDVRLLTVPLANPIKNVIFDGHALLAGLALAHSGPIPDDVEPARDLLAQEPASIDWKQTLPAGASFTLLPAGRVELLASNTQEVARVTTAVASCYLRELVLEVEEPMPGTGVLLGDEDGKPLYQVGFVQERRTKQTCVGFLAIGDLRTETELDPNNGPVPLVGQHQWIRLTMGPGVLTLWISGDGQHWSPAQAPMRDLQRGYAQVGLYCMPGKTTRSIKLRRLELREFTAITGLADAALLPRSLATPEMQDLGSWLAATLAAQPADVEDRAWLRACAVRTLSATPRTELARALLDALSRDAALGPAPAADRLRALGQMAVLFDTFDGAAATRLHDRMLDVARSDAAKPGGRPLSTVRIALLTATVWNSSPWDAMPESLARTEFFELAYRQQWNDIHDLGRKLRYFARRSNLEDPGPPEMEALRKIADWAGALAQRGAPEPNGEVMAMRANWRHPLVEQLGKEGYNVLAEFEAALAGDAWRDACQIISSSATEQAIGLLPNTADSRLFVSLPGAVASAMHDRPTLRDTMQRDFGALADIRLRGAIADDDGAAVQAITVQFYGTAAAVEARRWLGDRALAAGDFVRSAGQYREALESATPAQKPQLAARLRMASAMLGRDAGKPVASAVQLDELELAGPQFEQLVTETLSRTAGTGALLAAVERTPSATPAPAGFEPTLRAKLEGNFGRDPQNIPYPEMDWTARQLAVSMTPSLILVGNRFQVTAYGLDGAKKWNTSLEGPVGFTHQWPLTPMRPVVAGPRTYVRFLMERGPELACLDTETGKLKWRAMPGEFVASDPMLVSDQVLVISATMLQQEMLQLSLVSLNPATGEVLGQRPILQLRDVWSRQVPCAATLVNDQIIVAAGGSVISCDLEGQPRWLRRETWLPREVDPNSYFQPMVAPRVVDRRVITSQQGVRAVECLDVESGKLLWQFVGSELVAVVAATPEAVIVRETRGLVALDPANGTELWRRASPRLLEATASADQKPLLVVENEQLANRQFRPRLTWLDQKTGHEVASFPIAAWKHEHPVVGPLVVQDKRVWAFYGADWRQPLRELHELMPKGEAYPSVEPAAALAAWKGEADPRLAEGAEHVLPGWTVVQPRPDDPSGEHAELKGERDVLQTSGPTDRPVRLLRKVNVAAGAHPKLRMRVGQAEAGKWKLDVKAGDKTLLAEFIQPENAPNGWRDLEVDLTPLAGKSTWLVVSQQDAGGSPHGLWKRLELIP